MRKRFTLTAFTRPRLVAYETETLKQDMVIMVEPTALDPEIGGVRLEWALRPQTVAKFSPISNTGQRSAKRIA